MENSLKKKTKIWLVAGVAILIVVAGALLYVKKKAEQKKEETAITAMYVPYGEDSHIFVSDQGGVFVVFNRDATFKVYGINGEEITFDQLARGNMVKIYGDRIMAESYPGQYPGVTEIHVIKEGSPSDADIYQDIVDGIYTKSDPSEPPSLNVEYITDMMSAAAMITRGGYTWSYTDADGKGKMITADCSHVLQWGKDLNDLRLMEATDLTLNFSDMPKEVEVVRYDIALLGTQEPVQAERVEPVRKDGRYVIEGAEGSYVYAVTGIWENGRVEFGFMNSSPGK